MIWINIDRSKDVSLIGQVYDGLRMKILNRELEAGEKIPSTRMLSQELKVSRNIILQAYEHLISEGYLESREGSGTYVAKGTSLERIGSGYIHDHAVPGNDNKKNAIKKIDFVSGTPDLKMFPRIWWSRCMKEACLDASSDLLNYSSPEGIYDLRSSLSKLLLKTKGIRCNPQQVIILSGSIEGFLLTSRLATNHNMIIIEDPSYYAIRDILETMKINLFPASCDNRGMNVDKLPENVKSDFIIVTSHHFPLGGVLTIQRRIKLIEYSRRNDIYIIENDYDGEFRYTGQPVSSLHLLDRERVIHIGTFSESMYPGIRLGYMIVPEKKLKEFVVMKETLGLVRSSIEQMAMSYFIKRGYFERHLEKMKRLYRKKRELLISSLTDCFGNEVRISGDSTGLYVIAEFSGYKFNDALVKKIEDNGVLVYPVKDHYFKKGRCTGKLIMGYGNLDADEIVTGIKKMKDAMR